MGAVLALPILWFPMLREATPNQRTNMKSAVAGASLQLAGADEDLSVAGLLAGADWQGA